MRRPLILGVINATSYLLVCFNMRAIAQGNLLHTLATDLCIAVLGFTAVKRIAAASGPAEMVGYVIGGMCGSAVALTLGPRFGI